MEGCGHAAFVDMMAVACRLAERSAERGAATPQLGPAGGGPCLGAALPFLALSLPFLDLTLTFHCLTLTFHCLFLTFHWLFLTLPFLGTAFPWHCLSLALPFLDRPTTAFL